MKLQPRLTSPLKPKTQKPLQRQKKNLKKPKINWRVLTPEPVIGTDEAGRGCLAGPVVAGAVILRGRYSKFNDSKLLSEMRREELFKIIEGEHHWAVGIATAQEIDRINILRASLLAMRRAIEALRVESGHVIVDGSFTIPDLRGFVQTALIRGDKYAMPVSAASIVAKVTRDRLMREMAGEYPEYGFDVHKGYATRIHLEMLSRLGPTPEHRRTFRVKGPINGD